MYNKISLIRNDDDTYDICLYYISKSDTEFGLDIFAIEKIKNNINNVKTYLRKNAKNIKVKGVKILVNGAVIATMSLSSFMNVYGASPKYSMAYLYSGTQSQQISYINRTQGALDTVSPTYFDINLDGTLKINPVSSELVNHAHNQGMKVVPFLSNHWNKESGINALNNRENLSTQIANAIAQYNLDGVNVDIEAVDHNYTNEFTDFVAKLRSKIPANKEVSVAVASNPNGWTTGWHGLYDYTALGQHADYLMVMAYDEHWQGSEPGPVASGSFVERSITYALSKTSADKIVLGMPFYGRIWSNNGLYNGNGIKIDVINEFVNEYNGSSVYDKNSQSVKTTFTVTSGSPTNTLHGKTLTNGTYTVWHENAQSIQYKMSLINKYNLKGAGAWALGQEASSIWADYSTWLNTDVIPTPPQSAETTVTQTGIVTATILNVRSSPTTKSSIVGSLRNGTQIQILDTASGWHKIRLNNGQIAYVSASYVNTNAVSNTTTTTGTVNASALNVRSGPSTNTSRIGLIRRGTTVNILSTNNGWHTIRLANGNIGYVSSQYITTTTAPTTVTTPAPVQTTTTTTTGTVNTSALNVRSGPSTATRVIGLIRRGTTVTILSTANGWHNVRLPNGTTGYVSSQYISGSNYAPSYTRTGRVNTAVLNIRSGPSTRTRVIGLLRRNNTVNILSTSNGWHTIRLANGSIGYVSAPLVR